MVDNEEQEVTFSRSKQPQIVYDRQWNFLLYIFAVMFIMFVVFLLYKITTPPINNNSPSAAKIVLPDKSVLSITKLKGYAKDLGLDTKKFNTCLDSNQKQSSVNDDFSYGQHLLIPGAPGFYINGQFLAGYFPYEIFKELIDAQISGTSSAECSSYSAGLQKFCSNPDKRTFVPEAVKIDTLGSPSIGALKGKVTIVEFSDFECSFCAKANLVMKQILEAYPEDVTLYFKQYPLIQDHRYAQKAAEASLCAGDQGKFWEWQDKIFSLEYNK